MKFTIKELSYIPYSNTDLNKTSPNLIQRQWQGLGKSGKYADAIKFWLYLFGSCTILPK
jgi:hypothetical protein